MKATNKNHRPHTGKTPVPVAAPKKDKGQKVPNPPKKVFRKPQQKKSSKTLLVPVKDLILVTLSELSRTYADIANFSEAEQLVKAGHFYLAMLSVIDTEEKYRSRSVVTARSTWVFAQALGVLKKIADPNYDPMPETKNIWYTTEHRMRWESRKFAAIVNRHFRGDKAVPFGLEFRRFHEALLYLLGESPPVDDIVEEAHYGPGSTVSVRGRSVNYLSKKRAFDCVPAAVELAIKTLAYDKSVWQEVGLDPHYADLEGSAYEGFARCARGLLKQSVTSHDRLMFIFKSMTALRSIGAQPTCSGMLQLGIHNIGSRLLKERAKIDLSDQSRNQRLAYEGSRDWEGHDPYVTIDLTNASNSTACGLVQFLFPPKWAKLLCSLRTPGYITPPAWGGKEEIYQLYAGMGNGTTFFVETAIYWAAVYATSGARMDDFLTAYQYAVYGDDIIVRREHSRRLIPFLHYLGYRVNEKKSFTTGPFRESCGADYFSGTNVRPAILQCESSSLGLIDVIAFHNTLCDQKSFPLYGACRRIRALTRRHITQTIPTDPSLDGNLGFRPTPGNPVYDYVKSNGRVIRSVAWQRPRTYILRVTPKLGEVGDHSLDHWTQVALSLLRARQHGASDWSLPVRSATNYSVVPERDVERTDALQMLTNQLCKLAEHKKQPWFKYSQGL